MRHKRLTMNSLMDLQQYILTLHNNPKIYSLDDLLTYLHSTECNRHTLSYQIYHYTYMDKSMYAWPWHKIDHRYSLYMLHNWYEPSDEIYIFPDSEANALLLQSIRTDNVFNYPHILIVKIFVSLDYFINIYTLKQYNGAFISISLFNRYTQSVKYYHISNIYELANILKNISLPRYLRDKIEAYYFWYYSFHD